MWTLNARSALRVHLTEYNGGLCKMNVPRGTRERGVDIMNNLERK